MPERLTAPFVAKATTRASRYEIADSLQPGLRLVVQPSGAKSWAFRYERSDGQRVKLTLGRAAGPGALTLQQARDAANDARRLRSTGGDPADQKRAVRKTEMARIEAEEKEARRRDDTVALVLDRYYRDKVNAMKSGPELKRLLTKELSPWAKRRVDDIDRTDAIKLIDAIKDRGAPVHANRVRAFTRTFFGWCVDKALIENNPFERTKPVTVEVARDHVLSDDELRLVMLALDQMDWMWRALYRLLILTGQRRDEVAGMVWTEVDLDKSLWKLPAARAKNNREHIIPLPPAAVAILRDLPRVQIAATVNGVEKIVDSPFVLTTTGKTPVSGFSKAKGHLDKAIAEVARKEAKKRDGDVVEVAPWRIHDLRRTMASGMARLGVAVAVTEKVLNHVSGTFAGIVGVYQRHDFLAEKRHALNLWADHVASLTSERESNVVRLKAEV
ncbi:tyrosine-type recombinase/integrase [Nitrobacter sp.]|uniref:tyrosine-type recombinase/integrase n=1 Tax=Nitrobacter sp. TaxID=29420 RepID=UPI003F650515